MAGIKTDTEHLDQRIDPNLRTKIRRAAARSPGKWRPRAVTYLIFLGPAALIYIPFVVAPIFQTLFLSLFRWNGISAERQFVGAANFSMAFDDPTFWTAIINNAIWVVASIAIPMSSGLVLAVLISKVKTGQRIYSGIFFTPVVLNLIVVGLVWGLIYNPLIGPLAGALRYIGLGQLAIGWLGDTTYATPAIIIAGNWTFFGFCAVIFLQGLRTIDPDQIEAATLDGANGVQKFRFVTLPGLSNQITLLIVMSVIGSFKVFDIVYVMTKGGPNHSSEVIATYMYWQAFENGRQGYGAALAVLLTVFVAATSLFLIKIRERNL